MRLFIRVLLVALCSGNLLVAFGQTTTANSGFAVVTLISGNVAGLIATETLRSQTGSGPEQAVLAPSPLITSASLLVPVGPFGDSTTAIAIANPSTSSGSTTLVLNDMQGNVLFSVTVFLGPRGHVARFLNEFFTTQPVGFSPALLLTVSSEIPVGIVALNFRGSAFTAIPLASLSPPIPVNAQPLPPAPVPVAVQPFTPAPPNTFSTVFGPGLVAPGVCPSNLSAGFGIGVPPQSTFSFPATAFPATVSSTPIPTTNTTGALAALAFPEVLIGGNWSTEIAIGNTSDATQIARIDFFNSSGLEIASFTDIFIPARGVVSFAAADAVSVIH